jgi:hypothetical protein
VGWFLTKLSSWRCSKLALRRSGLLPVAPQVGWRDDKSAATQACASSQESTRKNDRDFIDVLLVLVDLPEFATKVSIINFDLCSTTLAGEVRMVAQPADSLLVLMATAKARKANTGLLKEAFSHRE